MTTPSILRVPSALLLATMLLTLSGCGGGGGSSGTPTSNAKVTTAGLMDGGAVTLVDNGSNALTISTNGTTDFPSSWTASSAYAISVQSHTPGITCTVANGSGTLGSSNVNANVSCAAGTESVIYSFAGGTSDGEFPYADLVMDSTGNLYGTTNNGGANNAGTVFKITPSGTESVLWSFGGPGDGSYPGGGLVLDGDGNIYGTTFSGGTNNLGTVFKITPTGAESIIWSFGGTGDGQHPNYGLAMDSAGNLYGTTNDGGSNNDGTVFKVTSSGAESVIWSFGGAGDGKNPNGGLLVDSHGNIYGTTYEVDATHQGTAFKITASGTESTLWSFGGAGDGQNPNYGLVMDAAGNLYGTTSAGGANSDGTVFKITPSGRESLLWSFGPGSGDGQFPASGLVVIDQSGAFYGITATGGANDHGTLFKVTASGTESILWSFGGSGDGQNPAAGLIVDSAGNLYGTTNAGGANSAGTVFKFD